MKSIEAIRGMNDILPNEMPIWHYVENILRHTLSSFGYQELRPPILEKTELFKRSIGEATDIVEKEMYTFLDRNEDSLTLRPELTASCVRAGIEHGLLYNQIQRIWYLGPCFRHERPQKGRYRQFYQCGAEAFGLEGPDIDAEIISLSATIFKNLNLLPYLTLQINSLGSVDARTAYKEQLVKYFTQHWDQLDEDSKRRLTTNPLRILDSKNPATQTLIQTAPRLTDYLDTESKTHFEKLQNYLTQLGIQFVINPCLVRGLDYYTKTVFEWTTKELGAQDAVCSGGRYDGLVGQLGGKPTPALGYAMGLERIILLLQQTQAPVTTETDIYFITDDANFAQGLNMANQLRTQFPPLKIVTHCGNRNLKTQFKKADQSGAKLALILMEEENQTGEIAIKYLREKTPQVKISQDKIIDYIENNFIAHLRMS